MRAEVIAATPIKCDRLSKIASPKCIYQGEQTHMYRNFNMGQPLGKFTGYTPGDGGLLEDMEQSWGTYFEELTQSEKLWLLSYVTGCDSLLSKNIEITQCIA